MKGFFKSKTIWFNLLYGVTAIAVLFGYNDYVPSDEVASFVEEGVVGIAAIMNIILRAMTKKPLNEKESLSD